MEVDLSYRGEHTAPNKDNGSPLYDVSGVYPDDIYTLDFKTANRYYGNGNDISVNSLNVIRNVHNRPNATVKIYRAVPNLNKKLDTEYKYYTYLVWYVNKFGFAPINDRVASSRFHSVYKANKEEYLREIEGIIKRLEIDKKNVKLQINVGDWVTINRAYAVEHGEATLLGDYKILTKTVPTKTLYTTGDDVNEWGYNI